MHGEAPDSRSPSRVSARDRFLIVREVNGIYQSSLRIVDRILEGFREAAGVRIRIPARICRRRDNRFVRVVAGSNAPGDGWRQSVGCSRRAGQSWRYDDNDFVGIGCFITQGIL